MVVHTLLYVVLETGPSLCVFGLVWGQGQHNFRGLVFRRLASQARFKDPVKWPRRLLGATQSCWTEPPWSGLQFDLVFVT